MPTHFDNGIYIRTQFPHFVGILCVVFQPPTEEARDRLWNAARRSLNQHFAERSFKKKNMDDSK